MSTALNKLLKSSGLSTTAPRKLIFTYLQTHDNVTASELISRHSEKMDQASVYRVLNVFRKLGIIQDTVVAGQKTIELSDTYKEHHHHMSCLGCGGATCIIDEELEKRLDVLAAQHGFTPTSHQLGISGYCKDCQA